MNAERTAKDIAQLDDFYDSMLIVRNITWENKKINIFIW